MTRNRMIVVASLVILLSLSAGAVFFLHKESTDPFEGVNYKVDLPAKQKGVMYSVFPSGVEGFPTFIEVGYQVTTYRTDYVNYDIIEGRGTPEEALNAQVSRIETVKEISHVQEITLPGEIPALYFTYTGSETILARRVIFIAWQENGQTWILKGMTGSELLEEAMQKDAFSMAASFEFK